eukprot:1207704-Pyramimonas_sp.AAC.1
MRVRLERHGDKTLKPSAQVGGGTHAGEGGHRPRNSAGVWQEGAVRGAYVQLRHGGRGALRRVGLHTDIKPLIRPFQTPSGENSTLPPIFQGCPNSAKDENRPMRSA